MSEPTWRERLFAAIDADGRSDRAISAAAGLGPNYIHQMRQRGTAPNIDQLTKLSEALNVGVVQIVTGLELDPEGESFIKLAARRTPEQRRHLIELLRMLPDPSAE